ncbi:MAG: XdhC family protein [Candidatus Latescibacterota bacterium]|nr:XdhC family protein [Candidatus Latescibacterota bacterium]
MHDIIVQLADLRARGTACALASLVESSGSIPMSDRAKMVIPAEGQVLGTIGGGCLEAEILAVGHEVLERGTPRSTRYTMTEQQAGEYGLNCGGTVHIFTELVDPRSHAEADPPDVFSAIAAAKETREACALATRLGGDGSAGDVSRLLFVGGRRIGGLASSDALEAVVADVLQQERPRLMLMSADGSVRDCHRSDALSDSDQQIFLEPFAPPPMLYVFGGGHVGGPICDLAAHVGFHVVVVDDRPMFASRERHPRANDCLIEEIETAFQRIPVDHQTYIIAASRGHQHDEVIIEQAIRTPVRYIGMLGSERKKLVLWKRIIERGGDPQRLEEVYAPIGANIGADNPEEIAVAVLAELIQVRRANAKIWKTKRQVA